LDDIIDERRIEALMRGLEAVMAELNAATLARDGAAQQPILARMQQIQRQLEAIRIRQDAALTALRDVPETASEDEQVAAWLKAFVFGAKLKHIRSDVMGEDETNNRVARQTYAIAPLLDRIGTGRRAALASLLDHAHPDVRAMAAVCLMKSMPERANPVLDEISRNARGTSAGSTAYWSLSTHRFDSGMV